MTTDLAKTIDHTLLKPAATHREIEQLCAEARQYGFYSVCVNGCRVSEAVGLLEGSGVKVAAVAGFPLGAMATVAKARETASLVADGAHEVDMVLNVGWLMGGEHEAAATDVREVVKAADGRGVKVILETCLLTDEQKRTACALAVEAGAAFVKTSTGFSTGGATLEDVALMKACVDGRCEVKASGGIRDRQTALAMIAAGATRLGTSSGIAIVTGAEGTSSY